LAAKEAWGLSSLLAYGGGSDQLSRVALCGGAGGDFLQPVVDMGADVFITADVSYHYLLHAQLSGIHLIVVNHGEMERASLPGLCVLLREVSSLDVVLLENSNWIPEII
jgi:putative NIF3 family GTP cyclohydrolase 1 type 2